MATMTTANINGSLISIEDALTMRDGASMRPDFRCVECEQPVRAHASGGHVAAHFEHLERNQNCSLSHVAR